MIRRATADDIPSLLVLGEQFADFAPFGIEYSPEGTAAFITALLDAGLVLVAEQDGVVIGGLLGALAPLWYSPATLAASELAWWVAPEHRGGRSAIQLLKGFESWARECGAKLVVLSDLRVGDDYPAGQLFERLGYRVSERAHTKEI